MKEPEQERCFPGTDKDVTNIVTERRRKIVLVMLKNLLKIINLKIQRYLED